MLDANALSAALRSVMLAKPQLNAVDGQALTDLCDSIAVAVVTHITTNAVVLPLLLVAPPGGGPVTGTGTIT
jgi:hypothetical protein